MSYRNAEYVILQIGVATLWMSIMSIYGLLPSALAPFLICHVC